MLVVGGRELRGVAVGEALLRPGYGEADRAVDPRRGTRDPAQRDPVEERRDPLHAGVVEDAQGVEADGDAARDQLLRVGDDDVTPPGVEADGGGLVHGGVALYGLVLVLLPTVVDQRTEEALQPARGVVADDEDEPEALGETLHLLLECGLVRIRLGELTGQFVLAGGHEGLRFCECQ